MRIYKDVYPLEYIKNIFVGIYRGLKWLAGSPFIQY